MTAITLQHVKYVPRELAPGTLYVSAEYAVAVHLCACGCRNKVVTPLGSAEWSFTEHRGLPTLYPSIGNWQLPCRSHYFITSGAIRWAPQWTDAQIAAGRAAEIDRRQAYYSAVDRNGGFWKRLWLFLKR